ncbi:MAG: hypothetical protein IPJ48_03755 [Propionivibrio sp.]|uniref:Uncharacterized protein n=1 Tax=Candidatus Propionivibrio dominans TaxID=2954373 RepID=A0A9D7IGT5_9RHOO|nr:hypothetical protein [Candidatus Propionivibrio dominans]
MKFIIPQPLKSEHETLHERLRRATGAGGEVGQAAKTNGAPDASAFPQENQMALPPLGLLEALARGEMNDEMAAVLELTDRLEAELPQMMEEHRSKGWVRAIVIEHADNPSLIVMPVQLRHEHPSSP